MRFRLGWPGMDGRILYLNKIDSIHNYFSQREFLLRFYGVDSIGKYYVGFLGFWLKSFVLMRKLIDGNNLEGRVLLSVQKLLI